ncbi:uncharacterized protein LOC116343261 isoform X2 [Contarinia nasturtii]|uniref:uncharacterized protein LOC116343261 isoform X2 n=1 Tax=Contarinia nasturtii TaxID=265458 RepID=UPI0012D45828|nr:uncharacterized protein LOC116343261 isoform X2 [Contarinia nasturtii]
MILFNILKHGLTFLFFTLLIGIGIENNISLAAENSEVGSSDEILKEIMTPWRILGDETIQYFINFANKKMREIGKKYNLIPVTVTQIPSECNDYAKFYEDDVQIMYGGSGGDVGGEQIIGHYICVHYSHELKRVHVYDSLQSKLYLRQKRVLQVLYPLVNFTKTSSVKYIKPKTRQNDASSCGLFSIAYATTVIFGQDPATYKLQLSTGDQSMTLRNHLFEMLTTGKFSLFPSGGAPIRLTTLETKPIATPPNKPTQTPQKKPTQMTQKKPTTTPQKKPTTTPKKKPTTTPETDPSTPEMVHSEISETLPITTPEIVPSENPSETESSVAPIGGGGKRRNIMNEIMTPRAYLGDEAINHFVEFVNEAQSKFKMLNINILRVPEECKIHAVSKKDDVQIFINGAGHYVCTHYKHVINRIQVYDSLAGDTLYDDQQETLKVLYPSLDFSKPFTIKFTKPLTTSKDKRLSGIFAIAYATTVILGKNPQYYKLKLNTEEGSDRSKNLRGHLFHMLVSRNFTLFPQK